MTSQEQELARRKIYQAMIEQGMTPDPQQVVSGRVVPYSPIQGLSKLAQAYMGRRGMDKMDEANTERESNIKQERSASIQNIIDTMSGRGLPPGMKLDETLPEDQAELGYQAPNPTKAAILAASDPNLQGSGISNVMTALINKKDQGDYRILSQEQAAQSGLPQGPTWGISPDGEPKKLYDPKEKTDEDIYQKQFDRQRAIEDAKLAALDARASKPGTKENAALVKEQIGAEKQTRMMDTANAFYGNAISKLDNMLDEKNKDTFNNLYGGYNAYGTQMLSGETSNLKTDRDSVVELMKQQGLALVRQDGSPGSITEREWPMYRDMLESILVPTISEKAARERLKTVRDYFAGKLSEVKEFKSRTSEGIKETGDKKEVSRKVKNGITIIKYSDGTYGQE